MVTIFAYYSIWHANNCLFIIFFFIFLMYFRVLIVQLKYILIIFDYCTHKLLIDILNVILLSSVIDENERKKNTHANDWRKGVLLNHPSNIVVVGIVLIRRLKCFPSRSLHDTSTLYLKHRSTMQKYCKSSLKHEKNDNKINLKRYRHFLRHNISKNIKKML